MAFKFERLIVWQKSLDVADTVNDVTKEFPKNEMYVLTSQMKRAADSVVLNIAEGSTGQSRLEFIRFIGYAIRSNTEVVACLHLAMRRNYINIAQFEDIYQRCEEILVMLNSLRKKL